VGWINHAGEGRERDTSLLQPLLEAVSCQTCIDQFGEDISQWKWGDIHLATFRNGTLGNSGIGLIEDLFNRGPFSTGGGESIVNATYWAVGESFEIQWLPSEREIVDLSDLDNSLATHTTGQSGHAYHPHYIDMAPLWAAINYAPLWWDKESIINDSEGHLILVP
jgi:penicillin amidase